MKKIIISSVAAIILIANYSPLNYFLTENYTYSNLDGSFTFGEEGGKGIKFSSVMMKYAYFLCDHPDKNQGDNRLFRTFTIKPWYFWEWSDMIFHSERFGLPYKEK